MSTEHTCETLLIEGPDAIAFAHAQFSSNVQALDAGTWQFSAWLDAQGRVRALFHLARLDEQRLLLLLRGGDALSLIDSLRRFVFRARLTLQPSPWHAVSTGKALPLNALRVEKEGIALGCETHSLLLSTHDDGDDAWRLPQLQMGWPWLPASALNALLPPALSMHRLHAVTVDKGCYPGQEIVARLHWRGGHKRHLHLVQLSRAAAPGTALRCGDSEVGTLLDVAQSNDGITALAVLSDDAAMNVTPRSLLMCDDDLVLTLQQHWDA